MIYLGKHKAGATVKYRANFHSDQGTIEDPTGPEAQLEKPDDSFTALTAPAKINTKTGHYGGSIDTTGFAAGQYIIRMAGTVSTAKTVATEFCFEIEANNNADIKSDTAAILLDTGTDGVVVASASKTGYALSAAGVDDVLDEVVEGTTTLRQMMRLVASRLHGKASGGGTMTITYRDIGDTKDRLVYTVDSYGNRTAVTRDAT